MLVQHNVLKYVSIFMLHLKLIEIIIHGNHLCFSAFHVNLIVLG